MKQLYWEAIHQLKAEIFIIDCEIERLEKLQQPRELRELKKLHGRSMKETKAICKKSIEQLLELRKMKEK